jgi:hypothetical protein
MAHSFPKKPVVVSLWIIAAGLLILSGVFVYYGLDLGIKPCQGVPSDAANCGDADMGGVIFVFAGAPIALLGIVSLVISLLAGRYMPRFNSAHFLTAVYIALAILLVCLAAMLFV